MVTSDSVPVMSNPRRLFHFGKKVHDSTNTINNNINNEKKPYKVEIVWRNVLTMTILHVMGFYGWYMSIFVAKWQSFIYLYMVGLISGFGVLAGSHRLWSHRAYKARLPLRIFLMILQTLSLQNDIYEWCRDHRVHHKWSETDADPHNSKRGFFFAHMGWLLCRKHPDVIEKGKTVDLSDVWADPVVRFQRRFYIPLVFLIWGLVPILPPIYFWNEPWLLAIAGNFFRYVMALHHAWLVNSWAHMFGNQPFDKSINPRDTRYVVFASWGEGYHNYHHAFPYDYSASEYGWKDNFNMATLFIDSMAAVGQAYELKKVPEEVIEKRIARTGDQNVVRKPTSVAFDYLVGWVYSMWPLWVSFTIRYWYYGTLVI